MGLPMAMLKKGMEGMKKKGKMPMKAKEGSAAEEAAETPEFEAGEKEAKKEYAPKGKK